MYGVKALLILLGFLAVATIFAGAAISLWRQRHRERTALRGPLFLTLFLLLWFSLISSVYIRKALFYRQLSSLNASDVYAIQIGRHEFTDHPAIEDIVASLRHYRWFEVNHGGWGDTIPMTLQSRSKGPMKLSVALYFREPGAILGGDYGISVAPAFAPELPQALERHGVHLPDCDTAHRKPCTADQLNP
jgi:hypothetical protein